jgi:uncharacterized protein involved in tellurium resistance
VAAPDRPDLGFLRRRPPRRPAPGSGAPAAPPAAATAPPPAPASPAPAGGLLDLGGPPAPAPPTPAPSASAPSASAPPATPPPAPTPAPGPAPGVPDLGWIRRRPPARRQAPDLVRTGNLALDLSGGGLRTDGHGAVPAAVQAAQHTAPVPPLRGRTTLGATTPQVRIGGEQATSGSLQLTLTWSTLPTDQRSVQAGLRRSTDVHLGALWEMNDGASGAVQELGGGDVAAPGYGSTVLRLGGRSETEGQTLTVALRQVGDLKRLVVYAYAISGRPEWDALAPVLSATLRGGVSVDLRLDPAPPGAGTCAIASLHRVGGTLVLRREAEYLPGQQQQVAEAYGWDLPWASGRTLPPVRVR